MRFQNAEELLRVKDSPLLSSITSSSSCLITVAESSDENVLQLLGMVNELNVAKKFLILIVTSLSTTLLRNVTINYNVILDNRGKGKVTTVSHDKFEFNKILINRWSCYNLSVPSFGHGACATSQWFVPGKFAESSGQRVEGLIHRPATFHHI